MEPSIIMNYKDYFPYDSYRKQQKQVIKDIYNGVSKQKNVLFVAPNGTGKTIDNLAATLPVAIDNNLKVIYLCRTHQQSGRVIDEIKKINKKIRANSKDEKTNIRPISAVSIRGRSEMCLHRTIKKLKGSPADIMNVCADLRKNRNCRYYNTMIQRKTQMNQRLAEISNRSIDAQDLIKFCKVNKYCPYFFAKLMLRDVRVIVCNYLWIFHPNIRETFVEGADLQLEDTILIMDECHNLPNIATDIESTRLTLYAIEQSLKDLEYGRATREMQSSVKIWEDIIKFLKRKVRKKELELDKKEVLKNYMQKAKFKSTMELKNFLNDLEEYGNAIYEEKLQSGTAAIDFISGIVQFTRKLIEVIDDRRFFFAATPKTTKRGNKKVHIELVCLDPRILTQDIFDLCYSSVSCSGTIHPESFTLLMGLDNTTKLLSTLEIRSPFPKRNLKVIITDGVNTRLRNRTQNTYESMIN
ncbi:MAG: hypothetical protein GF364_03890, partial [Candidatus Lokiarchaeota archaeon]|nr:hypothetical protein [Candidatus Lokiarchaeota archaeon]